MSQRKICFPPLKRQKTKKSNGTSSCGSNNHQISKSHHCSLQQPKNQEVIELLSSSDEELGSDIQYGRSDAGSRRHYVPNKTNEKNAAKTSNKNDINSPALKLPPSPNRENGSSDRKRFANQKHDKTRPDLLSYQRSAYVQNLAEICHDILGDGE